MNIFRNLRKPNPTKAMQGDDTLLGYNLYADGRIQAIKQGSGMYGAGFGSGAFSETAFGTQIALSQSTFGWSAAYSVSTWVYRCIEVRKSAVHRMPWAVYSKRTKQPIPKHPLTIALKRNRQKIFKKLEQSQLLYGETFIEKSVNDYGYTSDLFWLNNNGMAVLQGAGHIMGYAYTAMQGGEPQTFEVDEVAFMKTDNPFNDLRGMSPTEVIMDDVAIDKDVARVVRAYYANDTRVGVIFIPKTNLLPSDQERFMEFFKRDNQGTNKAGKPVLMPQDMTVERIQEPATLDDVQLRESTRRAIAAGYGVPLSLAGGWDDAKYQSLPEQRKSFYEETIIPECDNIAEFINTDMMPFFDDSGNSYFAYDYISILALTEDAQKKNDIYSNRLVSGLITRGEARQALGHPVRPQDDVYYIPTGATVIPANEQIFVTPNTDQVSDTTQEQQNEQPITPSASKPTQPSPNKPTGAPQGNNLQPKQTPAPAKSIAPPQTTIEDELTAWEKKALNTNAVKAVSFVAYIVPKELAANLRTTLAAAGKLADRATIKAIFAEARKALNPPKVTLDYWRHYDQLASELGSIFIADYMAIAYSHLEPNINGAVTPDQVQSALDAYHNQFSQAWLGTDAAPGPLIKLIQAGMGAAQEALYHHNAANPHRPVTKDIGLAIDWNLLATEARQFAQTYLYSLIKGIDNTTIKFVQDAVAKWIESGQPLDALKAQLRQVFTDPVRADAIAETESTRAYFEGARDRYQKADVKKVKLSTLNDDLVCDVCLPLEGTVVLLSVGWKSSTGAAWPPFHTRCRHWIVPADDEED